MNMRFWDPIYGPRLIQEMGDVNAVDTCEHARQQDGSVWRVHAHSSKRPVEERIMPHLLNAGYTGLGMTLQTMEFTLKMAVAKADVHLAAFMNLLFKRFRSNGDASKARWSDILQQTQFHLFFWHDGLHWSDSESHIQRRVQTIWQLNESTQDTFNACLNYHDFKRLEFEYLDQLLETQTPPLFRLIGGNKTIIQDLLPYPYQDRLLQEASFVLGIQETLYDLHQSRVFRGPARSNPLWVVEPLLDVIALYAAPTTKWTIRCAKECVAALKSLEPNPIQKRRRCR
jgi:hypothetical protein